MSIQIDKIELKIRRLRQELRAQKKQAAAEKNAAGAAFLLVMLADNRFRSSVRSAMEAVRAKLPAKYRDYYRAAAMPAEMPAGTKIPAPATATGKPVKQRVGPGATSPPALGGRK